MSQGFYQEIEALLKEKNVSKEELSREKIKLCGKYHIKKIPTDIDILMHLKNKDALQTKPIRTSSGVAVVAIMTAPYACSHGKCIFCPGGPGSVYGDVPQSYTGQEPATMRGIRNKYSAYLQVMNRLEQYTVLGHNQDKVELIIMGGTFPSMPKVYQETFVQDALQAMNDFSALFFTKDGEFRFETFKEFFELPGEVGNPERIKHVQDKLMQYKKKTSLEQAQKENETAQVRCIGMTIETKPDWGFVEHGKEMLTLGCTRIEVGIQTLYDEILKKVNRGHTLADTIKCLQELKDLGFKLNVHIMPGLPGVSEEQDKAALHQLFDDPHYRPDMLKIYPCMVAPGTPLYQQYKKGLFTPMTTIKAAEMLAAWKPHIPSYCRVQRIQRDVPTKQWVDGVGITNLRQHIHQQYKPHCRCIRCREPRGKTVDPKNVEIMITAYESSGGKEFFISAEDTTQDLIIGFCRLRFPGAIITEEVTKTSAFIRELHVFGLAQRIGHESNTIQHHGYGKQLLKKAEEIAVAHGKDKMIIISGIGVRQYYKEKMQYHREGPYMVKKIA